MIIRQAGRQGSMIEREREKRRSSFFLRFKKEETEFF